jgi:hypothetical protein
MSGCTAYARGNLVFWAGTVNCAGTGRSLLLGLIAGLAIIDGTFGSIEGWHAAQSQFLSAGTIIRAGDNEISEGGLADENKTSRRDEIMKIGAAVDSGINTGGVGRRAEDHPSKSGEDFHRLSHWGSERDTAETCAFSRSTAPGRMEGCTTAAVPDLKLLGAK